MQRPVALARPALASAPGQGLVEYGLILALIALVAILGLTTFGGGLGNMLGGMMSDLATSV